MISRREILRIGVAGAALFPLATLDDARPGSGTPAPLDKAIFDERFPASVAFASEMDRRGIPVHGIRGDITSLWYHDLHFRWRLRRAPIAGMTTKESLFCLELLAADAGLRVTDRRTLDDGLVSWSIGPRAHRV
jgi:hypothetical protein